MHILHTIADFFKKTGFSLSSSPYLVNRLIEYAGITDRSDITILELGAGNGVVTREIQKTLKKGSRLIVFEIQDEMILELKELEKDNIKIIQASVENIHEYCSTGSIDIVISTLPLGSMDVHMVNTILGEIDTALKKDGKYIQYQYALQNLKQIRSVFTVGKIGFELRNLWPAFVYTSHKR